MPGVCYSISMMNIQHALRQLRIARKFGKISNEVQSRTLRRLGYAPALALGEKAKLAATVSTPEWSAMMGLLAAIETEIAPALEAKRKAERDCLDIRYAGDSKRRVAKVAKAAPVVVAPVEVDYTCTPDWWKEQEKKERAEKKAATAARNAAIKEAGELARKVGFNKEQALAVMLAKAQELGAIAASKKAGANIIWAGIVSTMSNEFSLS